MKLFFSIILISYFTQSFAAEICSRTATINYQEVLIDSSAAKLGEGLRFYLEKDQEAKQLLDKYQEANKIRWVDAAMSTSGTGLILLGLFRSGNNSSNPFLTRQAFLLGGASLIFLSYLVSKTIQYNNEKYLLKSVEEYNKRNTPRIYFSPLSQNEFSGKSSFGLTAGVFKDF